MYLFFERKKIKKVIVIKNGFLKGISLFKYKLCILKIHLN